MKRIALLLFTAILLSGCLAKQRPGAIKITSQPETTIFIDGKEVGKTPYTADTLTPGETTIRLVPTDTSLLPWEKLVNITGGVYTIVNQELSTSNEKAAGEILTLEPNNQSVASMVVTSEPDAAIVKLNGESKGFTPLEINQMEAKDHLLVVSSPGYQERTISVKGQVGYTIMASVKLSKVEISNTPIESGEEATESASLSGTPTASASGTPAAGSPTPTTRAGSPTPSKSSSASTGTPEKPYVKISSTPTGWLRVRAQASSASEEVGRVNPGEMYPLEDEQSGWYEIEYVDGETGWISGQYAQKFE